VFRGVSVVVVVAAADDDEEEEEEEEDSTTGVGEREGGCPRDEIMLGAAWVAGVVERDDVGAALDPDAARRNSGWSESTLNTSESFSEKPASSKLPDSEQEKFEREEHEPHSMKIKWHQWQKYFRKLQTHKNKKVSKSQEFEEEQRRKKEHTPRGSTWNKIWGPTWHMCFDKLVDKKPIFLPRFKNAHAAKTSAGEECMYARANHTKSIHNQRKEERGKRKEERGKRKEERARERERMCSNCMKNNQEPIQWFSQRGRQRPNFGTGALRIWLQARRMCMCIFCHESGNETQSSYRLPSPLPSHNTHTQTQTLMHTRFEWTHPYRRVRRRSIDPKSENIAIATLTNVPSRLAINPHPHRWIRVFLVLAPVRTISHRVHVMWGQ
jgi:hypothetical protein